MALLLVAPPGRRSAPFAAIVRRALPTGRAVRQHEVPAFGAPSGPSPSGRMPFAGFDALHRALAGAIEEVQPDVIVVDHRCLGAGLALRCLGVSYVDLVAGHPTQLPAAGEVAGVPSAWPAVFRDRAGAVTARRVAQAARNHDVTGAANAVLRRHGADAVEDAFAATGVRTLLHHPGALQPSRRRALLPSSACFLGSCFTAPPPGGANGAAAPLVQVVLPRSGPRVVAAVATAVAELGWQAARPGSTAEHVTGSPVIVVSEGDSETVVRALTGGVRHLVLPVTTEQLAGAADLERAGLGVALDPAHAQVADIVSELDGLAAASPRAWKAMAADLAAKPGIEVLWAEVGDRGHGDDPVADLGRGPRAGTGAPIGVS